MQHTLKDLPEIEYLSGQPYPKVSPKRTHAIVQTAAVTILRRCAIGRGNAGTEWRFKLAGDTQFVPDVAFVSFERLRPLTGELLEEPPFAPDIAIEVRSPSRRPSYERSKIQQYLEHGARLVLDVDPRERAVYAHGIDGSQAVYRARERFSHPAAPWLTFDIDELFADLEIPR